MMRDFPDVGSMVADKAIDLRGEEGGYTLMGVMVFSFVIILAGMAFFTMSSWETRGAIYRQESSEAFNLADAAIERARARFLADRAWRDGWTDIALGNGNYSLSARDTVYAGLTDAVHLLATGTVGRATRNIEVFAQVPPTVFGLAAHVAGDADVNGDICVNGSLHVVGDPDFGAHDVHLHCGDLTEDFPLSPPPIYTDPAHFAGATYYYVKGTKIGSDYQARIYDAAGTDITFAMEDSLVGVTSYNAGSQTFTFDFDSDGEIEHYFNETTGIFSRGGGTGVVVNFGEAAAISPPGVNGISNVILDGTHSYLTATIINTRFTGVTVDQRDDPAYWIGGDTYLKQITVEPTLGVALIVSDFMDNGGADVNLGTATQPAWAYVTNDLDSANANFVLTGAITVLGDWDSNGHITINYDTGFLDDIPDYLFETWPDNVSGTLKILSWREF